MILFKDIKERQEFYYRYKIRFFDKIFLRTFLFRFNIDTFDLIYFYFCFQNQIIFDLDMYFV